MCIIQIKIEHREKKPLSVYHNSKLPNDNVHLELDLKYTTSYLHIYNLALLLHTFMQITFQMKG